MRTKRIILMSVIFAMVLLVPVFGEGQQEGTPGVSATEITIGTTAAVSGPVAAIGKPYVEGMQAFFAHINAEGGINGRQINLIVQDDQFNPANTSSLTRRLVERDGVFAMVGSLGTPCVLAIMDYLNGRGVPFIYQGAGATALAVPPKKYVFPFQPNYMLEGNVMVRYFVEEMGYDKLAIVYRNADDGQDSAAAAAAAAEYFGVEIVESIAVDPTATDFSNAISRLQSSGAQGVMLVTFSNQTIGFMTQAYEFGLTDPTFLATYANADPSIINAVGADKMVGFQSMAWVFADLTDETYEPWVWYSDYVGKPGTIPNAFAVAGMIAAELFTEAVRRVGDAELTRDAVVAAMESMDGWNGYLALDVDYSAYDPSDVTCRLGKQSMYVLEVQEDGTFFPASEFISYQDVD